MAISTSRPYIPTQDVCVDDIVPVPNEVHRQDLDSILRLTPADRRIDVALSFLGWHCEDWANAVGLSPKTVGTWVNGKNRIAYGGALRLARVMGQSPELLFEHWQ